MKSPNGIGVVCLAPNHPVLAQGLKVSSIDFKASGTDLVAQEISGKKKRGALSMHPNFVLCQLLCTNGERPPVQSGVQGSLFSVNHRLILEPGLIALAPLGAGHVAVVQLKPHAVCRLETLEGYRLLGQREVPGEKRKANALETTSL
jgi:hypothetical protein